MMFHPARYAAIFTALLLTFTSVPVFAADAAAAPGVATAAPTATPTPTTTAPTGTAGTTPTADTGTTANVVTPPATPEPIPTPAANQYSIKSSEGKLLFIRNGATVKSYNLSGSDLTLSINTKGQMIASFMSNSGTAAVSMGDQRTVQLTGTYRTVTADASLGGSVGIITDTGCNISTLNLASPVETRIYGTLGTVNMQAPADVIVERGATVATARMVNSRSMLTANGTVKIVEKTAQSLTKGSGIVQTTALTKSNALSGSSGSSSASIARTLSGLKIDSSYGNINNVRSSSTSSSGLKNASSSSSSSGSITTNSGNIRLVASPIDADYEDQLRSLSSDLANNVKAYDRTTGNRIYGDVYWVLSDTREVKTSTTYSFAFEADSGNYGEVQGKIRIYVDGDRYSDDDDSSSGRSYYFEIDRDGIDTGISRSDREDYRLEDISESDIEDVVTAYDKRTDEEISGDYEWVNSSKRLSSSSAQFRFIPDSSRYSKKTGTVSLNFDRDD